MSFLKNIFGTKNEPVEDYAKFWTWFQQHEEAFSFVVKNRENIEADFFDKLAPKLAELKEGFFFLTGMLDDDTVELVFTADGNTNNIVFVEELVEAAPEIAGWKFTSLKPSLDIENISIEMAGLKFNSDNLFFYSNEHENYPDLIDITVVHKDMTDENIEPITHGTYIFLDNYLGELDFTNNIDEVRINGKKEAQKELIPIGKLKDFLTWRQTEFLEKYDGVRYDTENDSYAMLEAELESGNMLFAVVNTKLLNWDRQASHPWIGLVTIKYDGTDSNGLPSKEDYEILNKLEDEMVASLIDKEGYLLVGRQTADNEREIYFACKDFRKPSKVFHETQLKYSDKFEIYFEIYKDKYWQSFNRFKQN